MTTSIIIQNGKIKTKADAENFIKKSLCSGSEICITEITKQHYNQVGNLIVEGEQYHIYKDNQGNVTATIRSGNLRDILNPEIYIADTRNPKNYAMTIYDIVWKLRKYINNKYLHSC